VLLEDGLAVDDATVDVGVRDDRSEQAHEEDDSKGRHRAGARDRSGPRDSERSTADSADAASSRRPDCALSRWRRVPH
jgi:hypothetical protein